MKADARIGVLLVAAAGLVILAWGLWIPAKAFLAQHLMQAAWQRTIDGQVQQQPWPWADITPVLQLTLPNQHQSFIVLNNVSGEALAFGPGHVPTSGLPGVAGITVVGGHRDTHFSVLREIEPGDPVIVETSDSQQFRYAVRETAVRDYDDVQMNLREGQHVLILATCYPFDAMVPGGPERFIVIADPI